MLVLNYNLDTVTTITNVLLHESCIATIEDAVITPVVGDIVSFEGVTGIYVVERTHIRYTHELIQVDIHVTKP